MRYRRTRSIFSDVITWPFFFRAPARAPRTEWDCHPVAMQSSSRLAPSFWLRRAIICSSLVGVADGVLALAELVALCRLRCGDLGVWDAMRVYPPAIGRKYSVPTHNSPVNGHSDSTARLRPEVQSFETVVSYKAWQGLYSSLKYYIWYNEHARYTR